MTDNLKFEHISNTTQNFARVIAVYPETTFPEIRKDKKKIESILNCCCQGFMGPVHRNLEEHS